MDELAYKDRIIRRRKMIGMKTKEVGVGIGANVPPPERYQRQNKSLLRTYRKRKKELYSNPFPRRTRTPKKPPSNPISAGLYYSKIKSKLAYTRYDSVERSTRKPTPVRNETTAQNPMRRNEELPRSASNKPNYENKNKINFYERIQDNTDRDPPEHDFVDIINKEIEEIRQIKTHNNKYLSKNIRTHGPSFNENRSERAEMLISSLSPRAYQQK